VFGIVPIKVADTICKTGFAPPLERTGTMSLAGVHDLFGSHHARRMEYFAHSAMLERGEEKWVLEGSECFDGQFVTNYSLQCTSSVPNGVSSYFCSCHFVINCFLFAFFAGFMRSRPKVSLARLIAQ
jgi:hypothetical protein